jgi:predicted transcriptional regulator
MIRVGTSHHLADCRGYAYEHRIEAEKKTGRRLGDGEMIHHINGDKSDNRHENIEIVAGNAEHFAKHRNPDSDRMLPHQDNPEMECACGCGSRFYRFDRFGRPRKYVSGHNPQNAPTVTAILAAIVGGSTTRQQISIRAGLPVGRASTALSKMKKQGLVRRVAHGTWEATDRGAYFVKQATSEGSGNER